jgi:hypothetical protein
MNHQELYNLLQTVQKNIRCPQCGLSYGFEQISIRGIVDSIVFLELNCPEHMPVLATVTLTVKPEAEKRMDEKINTNDVIEAHKFLNTFSGGFEQIFNKK